VAKAVVRDGRRDLQNEHQIARVDLHHRYGGSGQGGISPSKKSPNVFIVSDPAVGKQYGYNFDGWHDGLFRYTGEGQKGDQLLTKGNAAILRHHQHGRSLRVFEGVRGTVKYLGEFEIERRQAVRPAGRGPSWRATFHSNEATCRLLRVTGY